MIIITKSETQCRIWIKKRYPGAFIKKWPDFKQTSQTHSAGVPDFLVIHEGITFWVECKTYKAKTFTPAQKYMFPVMQKAGAIIFVWEKQKKGFKLYNY